MAKPKKSVYTIDECYLMMFSEYEDIVTAQEAASKKILSLLTEEEKDVYLRGRNAKVNSLPKHASPETYHAATAFEALWGYLYLSERYERLNELFEVIISE